MIRRPPRSPRDRASAASDVYKSQPQGYAGSLVATQARFGQGLASLVELEDARRNALASESAQLNLALERNRAWVGLYRALGGGFEPDMASKSAAK